MLISIAYCGQIFSPILTMATFAGIAVKTDDTLTISKAFTSFFLLTMLTGPLNTFLKLVPFIAEAVGSCNRVQI